MIKSKGLKFITCVYAIVIAAFVLLSLFSFVSDQFLLFTGQISKVELTRFTDFKTFDFILDESDEQGKTGTTQTQDVKLVLDDFEALNTNYIRTVHLNITFSEHPGEVVLFYAQEGEEFSDAQKIWAQQQGNGIYTFALPRTQQIDKIRIDPCSVYNVEMYLNSVVLNSSLNFIDYFMPSNEQIFNFIVYPMLACAFLYFIHTQFLLESVFYTTLKEFKTKFLTKKQKSKTI